MDGPLRSSLLLVFLAAVLVPRAVPADSPADQVGDPGFWAFQPVERPTLPEVRDRGWPESEIDLFTLARREESGLGQAPDARPDVLFRRVYLDLIGLPPPSAEIEAFVADPSSGAFTRVVDRLLASSHFGERWGRHWLDVVRFAESSGGGRSLMLKNAWRFRDYVIDSFNADKPYNRFVMEQVAGDLLAREEEHNRSELLVAAGFLALGPTNYELQDKELLRMEVVDEQIDTLGRAFLGMTLGCARCHDHKFDPVPLTDYYALAGIFRSTKSLVPGNVSGQVEVALDMEKERVHERYLKALKVGQKRLKTARGKMAQLEQGPGEEEPAKKELSESERQSAKKKMARLVADLTKEVGDLKKTAPPPSPRVMTVTDEEKPGDWHVHLRGEIRSLGEKVPRGFLSAVPGVGGGHTLEIPEGQSGRLELARWLAHPRNPLTARVYVNRIWHYLFGSGLVDTPDNFGTMGSAPSHPKLLDYLATCLVEDGWSTKNLIRSIVLSRTYRLGAEFSGTASELDPENRLLWRFNPRRLEVEAIRDSILAVSGRLDLEAGGLTIRKISQYDHGYVFDTRRRSVYVPAFRNAPLEIFFVFDLANSSMVTGKRTASTLPAQALYMLNSPFVMEESRWAAERLIARPGLDDQARIRRAYLETLGRLPLDGESRLAIQFLRQPVNGETEIDRWAGLYHALFASIDFRYLY